jgi:uridine kinase
MTAAMAKPGRVFIVGVGGPSGSGKSTVVKRVASRLGGHAISMEVYSAESRHLSLKEREKQNYDLPAAIDVALLESQVGRYAAGEAIEAPIYDFAQHLRVKERSQHIASAPVLIVEGILALHFDQLRPHFDLAIYLEAPEEVCFHRRRVRDITERQRSVELIKWQWENTVMPAARQYLLPSKQYANLVLDATPELAVVENKLYAAIVGKRGVAAGSGRTGQGVL